MKTKLLLLALLSLFVIPLRAQKPFKLNGTAPDSLNGKYIYIYGIDWSGMNPKLNDSVLIANGKFRLQGQLATPGMLVSLHLKDIGTFFVQHYIEPKEMAVTVFPAKPGKRAAVEINTSALDKQYREWRIATKAELSELYFARVKLDSLQQAKADSTLIAGQSAKVKTMVAEDKQRKIDFIRQHPNYYVSLAMLRYSLRQSIESQPDLLDTLLRQMPASLKQLPEAAELTKEIAALRAIRIGNKAPLFAAASPEGKNISLADYKGKYVLLDFWASWCAPCIEEIPNMKAAYEKYHPKGLEVLGVSLDKDRDKWLAAIAQQQLPWSHISELKYWNGGISKAYNINAIPATVLIDKTGKIIAVNPDLSKDLDALLK